MKNKNILPLILSGFILMAVIISACNKDVAPPDAPKDYSWVEEFDTVTNAMSRGWAVINNSRPLGTESWIQGDYAVGKKGLTGSFSAQSVTYSGADFVLCTYNAGDGTSTLNSWLISPPTVMKNGDEIQFYTRVRINPAVYPDRMQVRLNPINNGVNVGSGRMDNTNVASMVGDFTQLMLDINPTLLKTGPGSYPGAWTKYSLILTGLPAPVERRFAFRYFVTNGGTAGANSEGVAVDSVAFISK